MSNRILVSVIATGCLSRFRGGMQFTKTPKEIKVTEYELARLQADSYLQVNVISGADDVDGLAKQQAGDTNAGDEPKTPKSDGLTVIVEAMQAMHIDPAGDKPTVAYLKEHGLEVSAKQRDAAWDLLLANTQEANA